MYHGAICGNFGAAWKRLARIGGRPAPLNYLTIACRGGEMSICVFGHSCPARAFGTGRLGKRELLPLVGAVHTVTKYVRHTASLESAGTHGSRAAARAGCGIVHRREALALNKRDVRIGCEFVYDAEVATSTIFQVTPLGTDGVAISGEEWTIKPELDSHEYRDLYGNRCQRMVLPPGRSEIRYSAIARVPDATEDADESAPELTPHDLPDDVIVYTMPSRFCLPDMLGTEAWTRFSHLPTGYSRVQAICQHVNSHLQFAYGSSSPTSTAVDVNLSGFGVCRDFTHLAITFCRAMNIPARYVFGYLPDMDVPFDPAPMDFAAWMEVWLGDRWWTFDPRNNVRRKGRILIGRGRDASDVAMVTSFGGPTLQTMLVVAQEI